MNQYVAHIYQARPSKYHQFSNLMYLVTELNYLVDGLLSIPLSDYNNKLVDWLWRWLIHHEQYRLASLIVVNRSVDNLKLDRLDWSQLTDNHLSLIECSGLIIGIDHIFSHLMVNSWSSSMVMIINRLDRLKRVQLLIILLTMGSVNDGALSYLTTTISCDEMSLVLDLSIYGYVDNIDLSQLSLMDRLYHAAITSIMMIERCHDFNSMMVIINDNVNQVIDNQSYWKMAIPDLDIVNHYIKYLRKIILDIDCMIDVIIPPLTI